MVKVAVFFFFSIKMFYLCVKCISIYLYIMLIEIFIDSVHVLYHKHNSLTGILLLFFIQRVLGFFFLFFFPSFTAEKEVLGRKLNELIYKGWVLSV